MSLNDLSRSHVACVKCNAFICQSSTEENPMCRQCLKERLDRMTSSLRALGDSIADGMSPWIKEIIKEAGYAVDNE